MSNCSIKPIETSYKGYRFRSRTEARYAIYFDELKIKWDYELEGFELPSGRRYLPDFYFTELNVWVEIKSSLDIFEDKEIEKIVEFCENSDKHLLLIIGQPGKDEMFILDRREGVFLEDVAPLILKADWSNYIEETYLDEGLAPPKNKTTVALGYLYADCAVVFGAIPTADRIEILYHPCTENPYRDANFLGKAAKKARSARFEFGERK